MQSKPRHVAPHCLYMEATQFAPNILRTVYFFNFFIFYISASFMYTNIYSPLHNLYFWHCRNVTIDLSWQPVPLHSTKMACKSYFRNIILTALRTCKYGLTSLKCRSKLIKKWQKLRKIFSYEFAVCRTVHLNMFV